jgi:DNA polymerase-3 subunit delta'
MHKPLDVLPQSLFSWHQMQWQHLWHAKQQNRLPHALLLVGIEGLGKKQFAQVFATTMLCHQPHDNGAACNTCSACHLMLAGSHPDFILIEPEQTGKAIGVDQIRDIIKQANETTLKGGYRVIIIHPATAMNMNAANALLKTLEEPVPNTLFILISDQSLRLPATIISRCQKVVFSKPAHDEAMTWLTSQIKDHKVDPQLLLKLADGAPLKALTWLEKDILSLRQELYDEFRSLSAGENDPLQLANKLQDTDHLCVVDLLLSWLTDLLRYKLTQDQESLTNRDYQADITKTSVALLHANLIAYMDQLQQTRTNLLGPINLNKQLLLEDLFIRWTDYVSR